MIYLSVTVRVLRVGWSLTGSVVVFVQTINILIVNQSVADMCASLFMLFTTVFEVDGTRLLRSSMWDQFVCRIWKTNVPLWTFMMVSTYGIVTTSIERYIAVIYPIWYKVGMKSQTITNALDS